MSSEAIQTSISLAKECLRSNEIPFIEYNNGVHLAVEGPNCYIDFWPTTGTWIVRGKPTKHFGLYKLKEYILKNRKASHNAPSPDISVPGTECS